MYLYSNINCKVISRFLTIPIFRIVDIIGLRQNEERKKDIIMSFKRSKYNGL